MNLRTNYDTHTIEEQSAIHTKDKQMPEYFLSSHASTNAQHQIVVPDGCTVYFYVPEGTILSNQRALDIFNNLAQGITPGGKVHHKVTGGNFVPNYAIWDLTEYPEHSGVFWVGSHKPDISLTGYTQQNPLTLAQLFKTLKDPTALYWVACG